MKVFWWNVLLSILISTDVPYHLNTVTNIRLWKNFWTFFILFNGNRMKTFRKIAFSLWQCGFECINLQAKIIICKMENMCISFLKILNFFRGRFKRIASGWSRYDENYGLWKLWFIQGNNICMLSFYKVDTFRLTVVYMFFIYSYFKEKIYIGNAYCPILLNFFNKICSKFKLI